MPISYIPIGLTFGFETETETIPSAGSLVIGAGRLLTTWSADGALDLWRQAGGPGGGGWAVCSDPAGNDWDAGAGDQTLLGLTGIEAAMWRIENAIAAIRTAYLSVIVVG